MLTQPDISKINEYLSKIDGVSYIIAEEGLPIYWSNDMSEEKAEKNIALTIDIFNALKNHFTENKKEFMTTFMIKDQTIGAIYFDDNQIIISSVSEPLVLTILKNIHSYIHGVTTRCPWCNYDLSLYTFKCPKCGKTLPLGIENCPHCGEENLYLECPKCSRPITSLAKKIVYRRTREDTILGTGFTLTGIGFLVAGIVEAIGGNIISIPLFAAAGIIGWMGLSSLKHKIRVVE